MAPSSPQREPGAPVADTLAPHAASPTDQEPHEALTPDEFAVLSQELAAPLMATALRLTRNRAEAEDLVQETVFRALRSLASFRKGSRFRAWMFRIQHNAFINRIRRQAKAPMAVDPHDLVAEESPAVVPDIRTIAELPDLAERHFDEQVKAAVDDLSETYRVPMVLFALADMSYQEIADTLGIPIGTVMSRLHRARRQLRESLAGYAGSHGHHATTEGA